MHAALKAFVVAALVVIIDDVVVHLHVVAVVVVNLAGDCVKRESNLRFSPHATHPSNELSQANRALILPLPPCTHAYTTYICIPLVPPWRRYSRPIDRVLSFRATPISFVGASLNLLCGCSCRLLIYFYLFLLMLCPSTPTPLLPLVPLLLLRVRNYKQLK